MYPDNRKNKPFLRDLLAHFRAVQKTVANVSKTDFSLLVTRTVVNHVQSKVPVVATGTFSRNITANGEFIRKIHGTGVQAVILITSMLVEPDESEDVLKTRLEAVMAQTADIPLGVYECPVPYRVRRGITQ